MENYMVKRKRTKKEEMKLLVRWISILVKKGQEIDYYLCKPLSRFDFDAIETAIKTENKKYE